MPPRSCTAGRSSICYLFDVYTFYRNGVLARNGESTLRPLWGYPFNRCKLGLWISLALAPTIRGPWASFRLGSGPMRTAWTTWSGLQNHRPVLHSSHRPFSFILLRTQTPTTTHSAISQITHRFCGGGLFAFLRSELFRHQVESFVIGSAQPNFGPSHLKLMAMPLPPFAVQRRIAAILSAYDELIENNQRRIQILETMASALYREWFVELRFSGHERVCRVKSPLGPIPEGWEVKTLAPVAEVNRAQINARSAPDELHYIDIASVGPGEIREITTYAFADAPGRARRVVQHGDVLWSCVRPNRRSHALVMHPEPSTIASTGFAVLTASAVPYTFLYFATTTDEFVSFLINHATGAAYPAVTATTFEGAHLLIPPSPLLERFGEATTSMAEETHTLQCQIRTSAGPATYCCHDCSPGRSRSPPPPPSQWLTRTPKTNSSNSLPSSSCRRWAGRRCPRWTR